MGTIPDTSERSAPAKKTLLDIGILPLRLKAKREAGKRDRSVIGIMGEQKCRLT